MNRYFIGAAIALIIAMPTPVLALTIQNDLADQSNAELRYEFPDNFRQRIETIEARSGAKFYVYAGPYSPDDESLKRSPNINAGANKAEQLGLSLIGTGDYDADRTTVIAWLRNQNNPVKGSFGVAPSITHRRAGATSQKLSAPDGLVIPELRRYMPQDPSGAIVAISTNLWTLQQAEAVGATLGSMFGIGVFILAVGVSAWWACIVGLEILANKRKAKADREEAIAQEIDKASQAMYHLSNRHHDQGDYYQRLLDEPDVIKGMEAYLGDRPEALTDLEAYRAAVTKYSAAYTLMGRFCLNQPESDNLKDSTIEEAKSVLSTAENLEKNERRAQEEVDKLLVAYVGKYGGYIAYREESLVDRQGHIPTPWQENAIVNPWTGKLIYRWGGIAMDEATEHLERLAQADDWDSFCQFEKLIEIHRTSITDRAKLLADIEAKALQIATILDLWANYLVPNREDLVGVGTYYSQRDLIDYDAIVQPLDLRPPNPQEFTQQAAQLFTAGEFYTANQVLNDLISKLDQEFTKPTKRLAELMQMPALRRKEVELIDAMQRQSARAAAAPRTSRSSTSTTRSSSPSSRRSATESASIYTETYASPPPSPPSNDDWGGGGSYDSGAGGGDY